MLKFIKIIISNCELSYDTIDSKNFLNEYINKIMEKFIGKEHADIQIIYYKY